MEQKKDKKELHIMVDIETLGVNRETAPILSIAAKCFNVFWDFSVPPEDQLSQSELDEIDVKDFTVLLDIEDQAKYGRNIEPDTWNWWHESIDKEAEFEEILMKQEDASGFAVGLFSFWSWLSKLGEEYKLMVWSRGIDFDFGIIESGWKKVAEMYKEFEVMNRTPYFFANKEEVRTIVRTARRIGWIQKKEETKHEAMADVDKQIREVQGAMKYLSIAEY